MKRPFFLLPLFILLFLPTILHAVTYPFPEKEHPLFKEETIIKAGTNVYLFHSGSDDVKKSININDVLPVYSEYPTAATSEINEVGKIKVLLVAGDYYFVGVVIEGHAQPGYLAKKGDIACIIMSLKVPKKTYEEKHDNGGGL